MNSPAGVIARNLKNGVSRAKTINLHNDILNAVYKCNGRVFGGYVRDYLVHAILGDESGKDFKDLDVWFTNEGDYFDFCKANNVSSTNHGELDVKISKEKLVIGTISDAEPFALKRKVTCGEKGDLSVGRTYAKFYPFRRIYHAVYALDEETGQPIRGYLDVVICSFFPVCDFNVNCLSYNGLKLLAHKPYQVGAEGVPEYDYEVCNVSDIVDGIFKKKIIMFDSYYQKYKDPGEYFPADRVRRFEAQKWTIEHRLWLATKSNLLQMCV